jgi:hypothetical protein
MSFRFSGIIRFVFISTVLYLASCQEPVPVGFDLLDTERLDIIVADTFDLETSTVPGKRVITYRPGVDSRTYMLGSLDDPLFGKVRSELYLSFLLNATPPDFSTVQQNGFDSLVLILQYDTLAAYGSSSSQQKISVYELTDSISIRDTFYADTSFRFKPQPLAVASKVIRMKDSVSVINPLTKKTVKLAPHLRVRLNDEFGRAIIQNTTDTKTDVLFNKYFRGVYITSETELNQPMLYGFNLSGAALSAQSELNKLRMYYRVPSGDSTQNRTYDFLINTATVNRFIHDLSGSQAENSLNDPEKAKNLTFLQSMGGVKTVVRIKDLLKMKDKLINKATLDVYIADIPAGSGTYPPPLQIVAETRDKDGRSLLVPDISQLINSNVNFANVFGGSLATQGTLRKYTMNITNHVKAALRDPSYSSDIYLNILTEAERPQRVVFYGSDHPQYPMKLKITYTED